jgi:hypothetical protein
MQTRRTTAIVSVMTSPYKVKRFQFVGEKIRPTADRYLTINELAYRNGAELQGESRIEKAANTGAALFAGSFRLVRCVTSVRRCCVTDRPRGLPLRWAARLASHSGRLASDWFGSSRRWWTRGAWRLHRLRLRPERVHLATRYLVALDRVRLGKVGSHVFQEAARNCGR